MSGALDGLRVLVTRPQHQADPLCRMIEADGGSAIRLPLLAIEPAVQSTELQDLFRAGHDAWIFTSANAVRYALPLVGASWPKQVFAIGQATAAALAAAGQEQALAPDSGASSEALLALPEFQAAQGRHFLIVTGEGGRDLLRAGLSGRGARVERAEVYRRVPLPYPPEAVAAAVRKCNVVVITSGEALDRLVQLTPDETRKTLLRRMLVVPGARVVEQARDWGFALPPCVAEPMSDASICAACAECAARSRSNSQGHA